MLIFAVTGVFFWLLYESAIADVSERGMSQTERIELYKKQASEFLRLIDVIDRAPLTIDVISTGSNITIHEVYVDGNQSNTNKLTDLEGGKLNQILPAGEIVRLETEVDGSTIQIISESGRVFRFGGDGGTG